MHSLILHTGQEWGARRGAVMAEEDSQPVWAIDRGPLKCLQHCTVCGYTGRSPALGNAKTSYVRCGLQSCECPHCKGLTSHVANMVLLVRDMTTPRAICSALGNSGTVCCQCAGHTGHQSRRDEGSQGRHGGCSIGKYHHQSWHAIPTGGICPVFALNPWQP